MDPNEANREMRLRYLEMLQGQITRFAGYSAANKNYCLTVIMALTGLAFTLKNHDLFLVAAISTIAFALLDTKYLQIERAYRTLFDTVRAEDWSTKPSFNLDTSGIKDHYLSVVFFSWSIIGFYIPVAASIFICYRILQP